MSFININKWIDKFRRINTDENIPIIIVGNKIDLRSNRCVDYTTLESYANKNNYMFIECSVKNNVNLEEIFYKMIDNIEDKMRNKLLIPSTENGIKIESNSFYNLSIENDKPKKKRSTKCCIIS